MTYTIILGPTEGRMEITSETPMRVRPVQPRSIDADHPLAGATNPEPEDAIS